MNICFNYDGPPSFAHLYVLSASRSTGKERDSESGNDYFGARYYGSSMGRFLSPDPTGGNLSNPQTLNKYSYTLNNPLIYTDPTGLDCVRDNGDNTVTMNTGDCANENEDAANHEYYIDCDGCTSNASGATLDAATGSLYLTDSNGNGIAGTTISGFGDPTTLPTTVLVNGTSGSSISLGYGGLTGLISPLSLLSLDTSQVPSGLPEMRAGNLEKEAEPWRNRSMVPDRYCVERRWDCSRSSRTDTGGGYSRSEHVGSERECTISGRDEADGDQTDDSQQWTGQQCG